MGFGVQGAELKFQSGLGAWGAMRCWGLGLPGFPFEGSYEYDFGFRDV